MRGRVLPFCPTGDSRNSSALGGNSVGRQGVKKNFLCR